MERVVTQAKASVSIEFALKKMPPKNFDINK